MNNRLTSNNYISTFQFMTIIVGAILGVGALSLGRIATEIAGRDSWLSLGISGAVVSFNVYICLKLAKRFPTESFVQYSKRVVGKYLSLLIGLSYAFLFLSICVVTNVVCSYMVNTWILLLTPRWVIHFTMLLLCVYVCIKDLKVIARVTALLFLILIPFSVLYIPPIFISGNILNILPVGQTGITAIIKGGFVSLYCYVGYETILFYYPYVDDKRKAEKYTYAGIGYIIFLYTFAAFTQLLVYRPEVLKRMWFPSINFISLMALPFLERADILFLVIWIAVFFKVIAVYFYTATISIQQVFNIKDRRKIVFVLGPVLFFVSNLNMSIIEIDRYVYIATITLIIANLIFPILIYLLSIILKKGGERVA